MSKSRTSPLVKVGRIYQRISPYLGFIDYPFRWLAGLIKGSKPKPWVILLAPPRSGSTITYQVLRSGIRGQYLSNIWNLLYSTPVLGGLLSRAICKNKPSLFSSNMGFVDGLHGEAEGLRFWEFWTGQDLVQRNNTWKENGAKTLCSSIDYVLNEGESFVSGYLGHVFCVKELRAVKKGNVLFVHLTRNLADNVYSIYNAAPEEWFSVTPKFPSQFSPKNRLDQISAQLMSIHQGIIEQSTEDTIMIAYEDLCANPAKVVEQIIAHGRSIGLDISASDLTATIPPSFKQRQPGKDQTALMEEINASLNEMLGIFSTPESKEILKKLIKP